MGARGLSSGVLALHPAAHVALGIAPAEKATWVRACALRAPLHPLCAARRRNSGRGRASGNSVQKSRICSPAGWTSAESGADQERAWTFVALRSLSHYSPLLVR